MKYEAVPRMSPAEIEAAVRRDVPEELAIAVLSAALCADDGAWAESLCERLAQHRDANVRGNAVLGLGHIARIHRRFVRPAIQGIIERAMHDREAYVRGHAESAADDVEQFLGWKVRRERRH
jgi:hypothetical protein